MKPHLLITIFILFASCSTRVVEKIDTYDRNEFFEIDYKAILDNSTEVKLSDVSYDIEYVQLETNDNCLLHPRADYHFTDDYIFVDNSKFILQFDRGGKFIKQIGKPGRGPGEIGLIRILSVLEEEELLVVQTNWARKLYYFSYDGSFVRTDPFGDVMYIKAIDNNRFLHFVMCAYGNEDYMFMLQNSSGDTLDVVNNHYKWENKSGRVMTVSYHLFYPFYSYQNDYYIKSMHNDTVYHARGDSITPEYHIDLGSYKLPQEYRPEVPSTGASFREVNKGYRFVNSFEVAEKLFIASAEYSDEEQYNMIFDRRSREGSFLVDSQNFPGKIINDFDGGMDFWPRGTVNDSTIFMPVLPHQLISDKALSKISKSEVINPENKDSLLEMIDDLDKNDNPILMIVRLK